MSEKTRDGTKEVELSDGRKVKVKPVGRLLTSRITEAVRKEFIDEGRPLDPPTYEVTTVAGGVETYPHDEDSISTDEEKAAWAAHQEAVADFGRVSTNKVMNAILYMGVVLDDVPEDWVEERRYVGAAIPDNKRDLRMDYLHDGLTPTLDDLKRVINAIMDATSVGLPEEDVKAAEDSFRSAVEGDAVIADQSAEERVDVQSDVPRSRRGKRVGGAAAK